MTDETRLLKLQQLFEHYLRDPETRRAYLGDRADAFRADEDLSRLARSVAERAIAQGLSNAKIDELSVPELRTERNYSDTTASFLEHEATTDSIRFAAQLPAEAATAPDSTNDGMFDLRPTRDGDLSAPTGASAPIAAPHQETITAETEPRAAGDAPSSTNSVFKGLFGEISEGDQTILAGNTRFKKNINLDDNGIKLLIAARPDLLEFPAFIQATQRMAHGEWQAQKTRFEEIQEKSARGETLTEEEERILATQNNYRQWAAEKMATPEGRAELQKVFKQTSPLLPHEGDPLGAGFVSFRRDYRSMASQLGGRSTCTIMVDQKGTEYFNYGNRTEVKLKSSDKFEPRHAMNVVADLIQERADMVEGDRVKDFNITLKSWGMLSGNDTMGHEIMAALTQAHRTGCMEAITIKTKQGRFGSVETRNQISEDSIPASVRAQYPEASTLIRLYNQRKSSGLEAEVETPNSETTPNAVAPAAMTGAAVHVARRQPQTLIP